MDRILPRKLGRLFALLGAVTLLGSSAAAAQSVFLSDASASYSGGSLTTYANLADATAEPVPTRFSRRPSPLAISPYTSRRILHTPPMRRMC